MSPTLSPALRTVLHLKIAGYSHHAIATSLGIAKTSVNTYVKRLKEYFQDEPELHDPLLSSSMALLLIGQRYFAHEAANQEAESASDIVTLPNNRTTLVPHGPDITQLDSSTVTESVTRWTQSTVAHLLAIGEQLESLLQWEAAIAVYRQAEQLADPISPEAATAACRAAGMYVELGNYDRAVTELQRTQQMYGPVMQPDTEAELSHLHGWIAYDLGEFDTSRQWYERVLTLAHQADMEHLSTHAYHFLGRVYTALASTTSSRHQVATWIHEGTQVLEHAYDLHHTWGSNDDLGYDLFRRAQLLATAGNWREAKDLRTQARQTFDQRLLVLHLDLEDVRLALLDGESRQVVKHQAEGVLMGWARVKRAKGMSAALHLLGTVARDEGQLEQALICFIAALCMYPLMQPLSNKQVWQQTLEVCRAILQAYDSVYYQRLIANLYEAAIYRRGYFDYLNYVAGDGNAAIDSIFAHLYKVNTGSLR